MSASLIVDCSVTMTWLFKDEATVEAMLILDRLKSETALVPSLWFLEVANVLSIAERKGRITATESAHFVAELATLDFEVDDESARRAFHHLLPLSRMHGLTACDAAYLDLARTRGLPLASLDEPLRAAAQQSGIALLGK